MNKKTLIALIICFIVVFIFITLFIHFSHQSVCTNFNKGHDILTCEKNCLAAGCEYHNKMMTGSWCTMECTENYQHQS